MFVYSKTAQFYLYSTLDTNTILRVEAFESQASIQIPFPQILTHKTGMHNLGFVNFTQHLAPRWEEEI